MSLDDTDQRVTLRQRMDQIRAQGAKASDDDRRLYNTGVVLPHPQEKQARDFHAQVTFHNTTNATRRQILGITGDFGAGKSSIAESIAADVIDQGIAVHGRTLLGTSQDLVRPAFWTNATASGEADLAEAITISLGLPPVTRSGDTAAHRLHRATDQIARSMTTHGFIDDANMWMSSNRKQPLTQFTKRALNELPVTLTIIGKGLLDTPLFLPATSDRADADAANQLRRRLVLVSVEPIPTTGEGPADFRRLVHAAAAMFLLRSSQPEKDLGAAELAYLHDSTRGCVGILFERLCWSATQAVGGTERITLGLLRRASSRMAPEWDRR